MHLLVSCAIAGKPFSSYRLDILDDLKESGGFHALVDCVPSFAMQIVLTCDSNIATVVTLPSKAVTGTLRLRATVSRLRATLATSPKARLQYVEIAQSGTPRYG